ncbi:MAG: hypothetical protein LBQ90_12210 [Synergistaceae bacterium]|nr:hypothetical protein [Synergistaceae bacterium]
MSEAYLAIETIPACAPNDVIQKIAGDAVKGTLVYSPSRCAFAVWNDGGFADLSGAAIENVYEFRMFGEDFELRWVRARSGDAGTGMIMRESSQGTGDGGYFAYFSYFSLPGHYLLWGTVATSKDGVATLFDPRIGKMTVPVSAAVNSRIGISYKEYFSREEHGNLIFFAERLTGLVTVNNQTA